MYSAPLRACRRSARLNRTARKAPGGLSIKARCSFYLGQAAFASLAHAVGQIARSRTTIALHVSEDRSHPSLRYAHCVAADLLRFPRAVPLHAGMSPEIRSEPGCPEIRPGYLFVFWTRPV